MTAFGLKELQLIWENIIWRIKMTEIFETICTIIGAILLIVVCLFITTWIALWLWNIIAIPIFGAPALTFWQMYGLMWLVRLFFPRNIRAKKD